MNKLKMTFLAAAFGLTGLGTALAADPATQSFSWGESQATKAQDFHRSATEGATIDAFKPGEKQGAAVDYKPSQTGDEHGIIAIRKAGGENGIIGVLNQENKPGQAGDEHGIIAILKPGEAQGAAVDYKPGQTGDEHGIIAIRKAGGDNGLIGLLNEQNEGTGELVPAVRPGELLPAVKPADEKGKSNDKLGSLQSLGSVGDLFMHGSGGGAGKPGDEKGLNFTNAGPDQHLTRTDSYSLNFTNSANSGGTPTGGIAGPTGGTVGKPGGTASVPR